MPPIQLVSNHGRLEMSQAAWEVRCWGLKCPGKSTLGCGQHRNVNSPFITDIMRPTQCRWCQHRAIARSLLCWKTLGVTLIHSCRRWNATQVCQCQLPKMIWCWWNLVYLYGLHTLELKPFSDWAKCWIPNSCCGACCVMMRWSLDAVSKKVRSKCRHIRSNATFGQCISCGRTDTSMIICHVVSHRRAYKSIGNVAKQEQQMLLIWCVMRCEAQST